MDELIPRHKNQPNATIQNVFEHLSDFRFPERSVKNYVMKIAVC